MKPPARIAFLASLGAIASLAGACDSNRPSGSGDRVTYSAQPSPAPAPSTRATPAPSASRPSAPTGTPGWSAPVYRGEGPVVSRGPVVVAPTPTAPRVASPTAPTPPVPSASSGFAWSRSLREAQATARAQGKLIFLEAGRDACGNCMHLKNDIIPGSSVNGELGAMSVGYYDDVDRDPYSEAFNILYANVSGAGTLPLCGWVTPDLRWVHGFWGRRETGTFLAEISTARTTYQRMAEAARPASSLELGRLPSAGSLPDAELADVSAELADDPMIEAAPPAVFDPTADAPLLATLPEEGRASPPAPASDAPPVFATTRPTPSPSLEPIAATPAPAPAPADAAPSPEEANRTWVRAELQRAAAELAAKRYTAARSILSTVRERASGLPESREADKGEVAIFNLRRIEKASAPADADRLKESARKDLKGTVWAALFTA